MIISVPNPSKVIYCCGAHRELIFFEEMYPIEVVPLGGRFEGRVPFSVTRLLLFLSLGGFPMSLMIGEAYQKCYFPTYFLEDPLPSHNGSASTRY